MFRLNHEVFLSLLVCGNPHTIAFLLARCKKMASVRLNSRKLKFPVENYIDFECNGLKVATYCHPVDNAKAVAIMFHGLNSHAGAYADFATSLAQEGIECVALDLLGHGRSGGKRGFIESDLTLVCLVTSFVKQVHGMYAGLQLFLVGGSMGGLLSLIAAVNCPSLISGLILFSPCLGVTYRPEPFMRGLAMCLAKVFPTLPLSKADPSIACKDQDLANTLYDDPLFYSGRVAVGTCYNVLKLIHQFREMGKNLGTRYICIQGLADPLVCPKIVQKWHADSPVADKTIHVYPELRHSVFLEPEYADILPKVLEWVRERLT